MVENLTMEEGITIEEEMAYGATAGEIPRQATASRAVEKAEAEERDEAKSRLSAGEKVLFAGAGVFTAVILVVGVMLTIAGFIFSPAVETLAFGLLTGGFGVTLYVIWRGGRK
jgi:cytochrome b subunit of formate dehydrogenase